MATIRDLYVLSIFLMLYIAEVQGRRWGRFIKYLQLCINAGCTSVEIALLVTTIVLVIFCCCIGACFKEKIRMILIKCFRCNTKDRNDNDQSMKTKRSNDNNESFDQSLDHESIIHFDRINH